MLLFSVGGGNYISVFYYISGLLKEYDCFVYETVWNFEVFICKFIQFFLSLFFPKNQ